MKKLSVFIALVSLTAVLMAKGPAITFKESVHDFKEIEEMGGLAKYDFEFTNTGDAVLVINSVRASCGCTTPSWTKTPIEPGKKGVVSVAYDPQGRPGSFIKTITVHSNVSEEDAQMLQIKGKVVNTKQSNGPKSKNRSQAVPYTH